MYQCVATERERKNACGLLSLLGLAWLGGAWVMGWGGVGGLCVAVSGTACSAAVKRHVCMASCAAPKPNRARPLNWHIIKLIFFCILAGHVIDQSVTHMMLNRRFSVRICTHDSCNTICWMHSFGFELAHQGFF